jgi:hypothetical protein
MMNGSSPHGKPSPIQPLDDGPDAPKTKEHIATLLPEEQMQAREQEAENFVLFNDNHEQLLRRLRAEHASLPDSKV